MGTQAKAKGPHHRLGFGIDIMIGTLLVAGGLGAINTAMIIGALPFSVMALMGIFLFKAVIRDGAQAYGRSRRTG